jgi:hypothetical protein
MNFEQLNARINELWTQTKAGKLPRADRFAAIERLTDEYIAATGRRPDPAQLDRLATLCLYDEITDSTPYRIQNTEYPIMGERLFNERSAKNVPLKSTDYEQERKLTGSRRKRHKSENAYIDRTVKAKNKERRKRYNDFVRGKTEGVLRVAIKETE